jgi:hypothetical protein
LYVFTREEAVAAPLMEDLVLRDKVTQAVMVLAAMAAAAAVVIRQ